MTPQEFKAVEPLFHQALEIPPGLERERFVRGHCPVPLADFLRALLEADAAQPEPAAEAPGPLPRCGPYQAESLLGSGGMGLVYRAIRGDGQFEQTVALKLLRAVARTDSARLRFRAERQILAQLQHPHIAALHDGGVSADGEPYLVMEFVDGEPLDRYCDQRRMPIGTRLSLFRQVLEAVEYAHCNFIVHGDLKPSNILVTAESVKLLDFGTSRFLDEQTPTTLAAAMTPKYASPEQLRGERLTTASDVFSLGLILYELLIGAPAFPSGSSLISVMARAVEDTNPADPGLAITEAAAAARGCSVSQLREAVCGDLASVVHKALAHEPEQRYPSVGEFAADLERYREGQPILARPQTWKYRAAKFLRRNRISATAGVIVAIALIASAWVSLYQARVAAQQRRIAEVRLESLRKLTSTVLFEFHDAIQQLPGATQARKLLAQRALEYLNSVDPATTREPAQRAQRIEAYREIGDVQGNPTNANLGDTAGALASYNKALALAEPMVVSNPNDLNARRNLALLLQKIADTQAVAGDVPGAVERSKRSLAMFIDLASRDKQVGAQQQAGTAHIKLADLLGHPSFANLGDRRGALEHYQQAEQIYVSLSHPADAVTRRYLGIIDERIGRMLELDGRTAEALPRYEQSFAIREALATDYPTNTNARRDVAIAHEKIGDLLLASGQIGGALSRFRKALDIFESLHALDPLNANATRAVAIEYEKLATTYERAGDRASASPLYRKALNIYRGMSAADPSNMRVRSDVDRLVKHALRRVDLSSSQH